MPETGSQILSYVGDKNLGQGSNANIPVIDSKFNLDIINSTGRDIMLLNHDNNIRLYDQKIKDRDETLKLLADGQIASGDIDPADRPMYEKAKNETKDAFYKMIESGGLNNPDAVREYQEKVTDLYNTAIHAQGRQLEYKKLYQEKSQQSLPEDIKLYDNHINDEKKKDFWQPINPLQKAFNYDIDASTNDVLGQPVTESQIGGADAGQQTGTTQWNTITNKNGVITQKQTTKTSPLKSAQLTRPTKGGKGVSTTGTVVNPDGSLSAISMTPEKYWDYPTIEKNVQEQYISDPKARYTYQSWLSDVEKLPPDQKIKLLTAYNNRIAEYSTARGIQPDGTNKDGSPHYPDQVKYFSDPVSGQTHINETPASFFAKHALASIKGDYVEESKPVFDKDIGTYNINKQKANTDSFYKHAMANNAYRKTTGYLENIHQQMKLRKTGEEQDALLNDLYTKNVLVQPSLFKGVGNNKVVFANIKANNSLPLYTYNGKTFEQLKPIGAKNITDLKTGKVLGWEGGEYQPQYIFNGKVLDTPDVTNLYNIFKQNNKKWSGGIDDFLKGYINSPDHLIEVQLKGENGVTNKAMSNAALKSKTTKKGQESVFDNEQPPLDENTIPDASEEK